MKRFSVKASGSDLHKFLLRWTIYFLQDPLNKFNQLSLKNITMKLPFKSNYTASIQVLKNYKNISKRHQRPSQSKRPCTKCWEERWIVFPGFKLIPQRQNIPGGKEAQWGVISEWGICKLLFVLFWWREHNALQVCYKNQYLTTLPYEVNTLLQVWIFFLPFWTVKLSWLLKHLLIYAT